MVLFLSVLLAQNSFQDLSTEGPFGQLLQEDDRGGFFVAGQMKAAVFDDLFFG